MSNQFIGDETPAAVRTEGGHTYISAAILNYDFRNLAQLIGERDGLLVRLEREGTAYRNEIEELRRLQRLQGESAKEVVAHSLRLERERDHERDLHAKTQAEVERLREALEPFAHHFAMDEEGCRLNDRIKDWFGVSDFRVAYTAHAASQESAAPTQHQFVQSDMFGYERCAICGGPAELSTHFMVESAAPTEDVRKQTAARCAQIASELEDDDCTAGAVWEAICNEFGLRASAAPPEETPQPHSVDWCEPQDETQPKCVHPAIGEHHVCLFCGQYVPKSRPQEQPQVIQDWTVERLNSLHIPCEERE